MSDESQRNHIAALAQDIEEKKAECAQLDVNLRTALAEVTRRTEYVNQLKTEVRCVRLEPTDNLYRVWGEETGHQHWQYVFAASFDEAMALYILTQETEITKVELVADSYCLTGKTHVEGSDE